jgi:exosortase
MAVTKATLAIDEIAPVQAAGNSRRPFVIASVLLGLVWFEILLHLRAEWSYDPQYNYGWSVPFLVLFLLWRRWPLRPPAATPSSRFWPSLILAICILFLPVMRFLSEANPDWRFLSWAGAFLGLGASLSLLFLLGGKPWVRHFAFPFLFFLVAVPWPVRIEQGVTQSLMQAVTAINVFGLHLAAIPALQHGNVIEVGSGLIGIEEACSGVRSLQATFMISLFLGELYSFSVGRRICLFLAGAVLAFLCNLVRTALLVFIGTQGGGQAIHVWHDPAGLTIMLCCLFGLWLISLFMQRRTVGLEPAGSNEVIGLSIARPPIRLLLAAWCYLLIGEAAVQVWYKANEAPLENSRWSVQWPTTFDSFKKVPIAPEAESLLRYNEGGGASWTGADGHPWLMYNFRWLPGRTAALFVKIHRPDVCLPASGMTLIKDDGVHLSDVNGVPLPVRTYRFEARGVPLHVLYYYWDARSAYETARASSEEDWSNLGRVRAAFAGKREVGAQMLELVVWGYERDEDAKDLLIRQLRQMIKPG